MYVKDPNKRGSFRQRQVKRPERPSTQPGDRQGPKKLQVVPIVVGIIVISLALVSAVVYRYIAKEQKAAQTREAFQQQEHAEKVRQRHLKQKAQEEASHTAEATAR